MKLNVFNLCGPAFLYLAVSVFFFVIILLQNLKNPNQYCVGDMFCNTQNLYAIFLIKAIYIAIWTWILNIICSAGYTWVSWLLVLVPFILFFIMILFLLRS